ncbi:MAG: hypothetical protein AB1706_18060, partial [Pseudomonadota bacterium]
MIRVIENYRFDNFVNIATFQTGKFSNEELKMMAELIADGANFNAFSWNHLGEFKNLVMDYWKNSMLITLFDSATKLLVTNQATSPQGNESTPTTGILYTATSTQETLRKALNPYRLCYQISD